MALKVIRSFFVVALVAALGSTSAIAQTKPGDGKSSGRSSGIGNARDKEVPMEITSDNMELQRDAQKAIFRGNVEAIQGGTRLRADSMVVYYREKSQRDQLRQEAQAAGAANRPGTITRVDAFGKVFISADDETMQGDKSSYDLDKRVIVTEGRVVVTRGQDILNCAKLTIHLDTKQNYCENAPGGRVKGIFTPNNGS